MESQNGQNVLSEVTQLIRSWEEEHSQSHYNPLPTLTKLAEKIEMETENYMKMDPDPFDERHPSRTDPDCKLGQILKSLFRKDNFMTKLVNDYLRDTYYSRLGITGRDVTELNVVACRLMLDIMPGLETSVVFQPDMDALVLRLIKWTTKSSEPLQSYATGLLAAAMEIPETATKYREQNGQLVPLLLQRLRSLQLAPEFTAGTVTVCTQRPFAHLSATEKFATSPSKINHSSISGDVNGLKTLKHHKEPPTIEENTEANEEGSPSRKRIKLNDTVTSPTYTPTSANKSFIPETSNSAWEELQSHMIGSVQMFPPNNATKQILILRYLTPMGEYQEFLSHAFENKALELIFPLLNIKETKEARLAFEALKYLSALLCHKKFSIEFVLCKGLECLLEVARPSIAATGVSMCLYYLGYCEEAMERVCLFSKYIVTNLVKYALWLLECSHDSSRCHATMFFGLTFQFKVILEEFDEQDGLRKLHNVIATLPILSPDENVPVLNEDAECASRQIVRHVCVAYKRYLEAHLYLKVEQLRRSQLRHNERPLPAQPSYKACKSLPEEVQEQIDTLLQQMPFRTHWQPIDQLLKLGGITLLLKIIAYSYEWNYSGRAETVRSALDALAIACVMPRVQLLFCERVDLPEESVTVGINIILGAADGEIVADPDVQKAALRVIVNCVCAPIHRMGGAIARYSSTSSVSPSKKTRVKSSEDLIQKMWESVRSNNGIMVLLQLMNVKTPITDADCIRTLACKALAGLARSETVRQIVSKLPLFTNGHLQVLMRDPILQEKRQEHVAFQKYALQLLERLSGKTKHMGNDLEVSLSNIHRANVVAQTKIHFNDRQLLFLICQHLRQKGLNESAAMLQREGQLVNTSLNNGVSTPLRFRYTSPTTPNRARLSALHRLTSAAQLGENSPQSSNTTTPTTSTNTTNTPSTSTTSTTTTTPSTIKIIKKNASQLQLTPTSNSRLQKQISYEPHTKSTAIVPSSAVDEITLGGNEQPRITLDSIITEYLTNQHALCKNPMATCPQFNLFVPHKCPDPKPKLQYVNNFAMRHAKRQLGYQCKYLDRRFIHTRFCPSQTIRAPTEDGFYTCVSFMPGDQSIVVGEWAGEIRLFNINTGNEESSFTAHDSYIANIEPNRAGTLLLSSSTWGRPLSVLWSYGLNTFESNWNKIHNVLIRFGFEEEDYVEFSKTAQDKIIGTKGEIATIYDVNTCTMLLKLIPTVSNRYTANKATFSPNDDLVLSDGVLFDAINGQQIHKLDKLNLMQSGVFHPNGLEIVSNTEVWDIRTFQLLKTVPALNLCQATFAPTNNAIYAFSLDQEADDDPAFDSSFKTLDATDYSSISTMEVKRNIYDLTVNRFDSQIAIVENQGAYHAPQESVVRIYDVGRRRDDEDEQEEDDDDDEDNMDDASDDDGSSNVFMDLLAGDAQNNDNDNDEDDDDDDGSGDSSDGDGNDSWTDVSEDSDDDSFSGNSSSGMSMGAIEGLLLDY